MQRIQFLSGTPRSGSTLFQQIIGQNPDFHPTPTDGFINWWMQAKRGWKENNNEFRAMGMDIVKPRVVSAMRGMFEGFFEEELSQGKTVFLKSRGYMGYIEYLKEIFGDDVKVICLVRDIRAILASFEKLYRKRGIEYPEFPDEDFVESQTVEGRANIMLRKNGVVGLPITRLQDALRRHPKNLVIVTYQQMLSDPKSVFESLHDILELPKFEYDFENIKQVTHELDVYHGYKGLHDIKEGPIVSPKTTPWEGIFEESFSNEIGQRYQYLNSIANS